MKVKQTNEEVKFYKSSRNKQYYLDNKLMYFQNVLVNEMKRKGRIPSQKTIQKYNVGAVCILNAFLVYNNKILSNDVELEHRKTKILEVLKHCI